LLSYSEKAPTIAFAAGTDGAGAPNIMVEDGSFRRQSECLKDAGDGLGPGCGLGSASLKMNGAEVFSFSLQKVPPLVDQCIATAGWSLEDCGDIVFHQANGFMLNTLAEKIGIPESRVPKSLEYFGNTSSASIPMTLVTQRREALRGTVGRYVLAGFGVGWSWAGIAAEIGGITVPELVEVE
jgi:3-oxoacyl-[acyl-carrier-protein] synthase-3